MGAPAFFVNIPCFGMPCFVDSRAVLYYNVRVSLWVIVGILQLNRECARKTHKIFLLECV